MSDLRTVCPFCLTEHDGKMRVGGSEWADPSPGSISVCADCSFVAVFDERLHLRLPTTAEVAEFMAMPEVVAAIQAVRQVLARRRHGG